MSLAWNYAEPKVTSPDSLFAGITVGQVAALAEGICDKPQNVQPSMIRAAYRAMVRVGLCTEAEAAVGVEQVLKLRASRVQPSWKHDAPLNPAFLGAQPARVGEDY